MLLLALRNLLEEKQRFVTCLGGVAFAVLLVAFQVSVLLGVESQLSTYVDHTSADIWGLQKDVDDFLSMSLLPREVAPRVREVPGVHQVTGILAFYTTTRVGGEKSYLYLVGYDVESGNGGPWKLAQGSQVTDPRQLTDRDVLLDKSLAQRSGLKLGDRVSLMGSSFTVRGFTLETNSVASQYAFITRSAAERLAAGSSAAFTHLLIELESGASADAVAAEIGRRVPEVNAVTRASMTANTVAFVGSFLLPLLLAGIVVGALVGLVVVAMTIHTATLEKIREYGTLKAIGASDWAVARVVLQQALIAAVLGYLVGLALAYAAIEGVNAYVPGLTAYLPVQSVVTIFLLAVAIAALASYLPARRVMRTDPALVFRGL